MAESQWTRREFLELSLAGPVSWPGSIAKGQKEER
jgi:hypothetical protein